MGPETESDALQPRRSGGKGLTGQAQAEAARSAGPWWRGRALIVLKRVLWWAGLVLLLPAPAALHNEDAVYGFFASLPPRLDTSTGDVDRFLLMLTLTEERILATLVAGFVCWALCAVLGVVVLLRESDRPAPRHSVWRVVRRLTIVIVSTVFLLAGVLVGLLCNVGIDLYYNPIP